MLYCAYKALVDSPSNPTHNVIVGRVVQGAYDEITHTLNDMFKGYADGNGSEGGANSGTKPKIYGLGRKEDWERAGEDKQ